MRLKKAKSKFLVDQVTFLCQLIDGSGIQPDPGKMKAILEIKHPSNVSEVHCLLGVVNQKSKFSPNTTEITYC